MDLGEGVITFALRARPKTYVPGMEALRLPFIDSRPGYPQPFPQVFLRNAQLFPFLGDPSLPGRWCSMTFLPPSLTR